MAFSVCSFPESLIDDELFGHQRGAFTGANQGRRGRFEEANGGTIFIDEIGDLALPLQAKLLRTLQERTVSRLGSNASHNIDVRVICATNRNLEQMVREGTFREDLYFRISVVKIAMPSLRERRRHSSARRIFPAYLRQATQKAMSQHDARIHESLSRHPWPGNVRELQNVIERSVVLGNGHDRLGIDDLPPELQGLGISDELPKGSFHEALKSFKRDLVRGALATTMEQIKAAKEWGSAAATCIAVEPARSSEATEEEAELLEVSEIDELPTSSAVSDQRPKAIDPVRVFRSAVRIA